MQKDMRSLTFLLMIMVVNTAMAQSPDIEITTKSNSTYEQKVAKRVEGLLEEYDLSKWIFTRKVLVEDHVIPHSHPVLTLNTKKQGNDGLLSTFIHEQLHWHFEEHKDAERAAIAELKTMYKDVPVGNGEGARDEYSTYLHLMVCYLEYVGLMELVGKERAEAVITKMNHYKWIYRQVLKDGEVISALIDKHQLNLKG